MSVCLCICSIYVGTCLFIFLFVVLFRPFNCQVIFTFYDLTKTKTKLNSRSSPSLSLFCAKDKLLQKSSIARDKLGKKCSCNSALWNVDQHDRELGGGHYSSVDSSAPTILRSGFKSQRHHIHFYVAKFCALFEMDEYKQKEVGFGPYLKKPDRE